jgi:hypothetical protein
LYNGHPELLADWDVIGGSKFSVRCIRADWIDPIQRKARNSCDRERVMLDAPVLSISERPAAADIPVTKFESLQLCYPDTTAHALPVAWGAMPHPPR